MGLSPSSYQAIQEPAGVEMWGMTHGHAIWPSELMERMTRWFEVHDLDYIRPRVDEDLGHFQWLRDNQDILVYVNELTEECPQGVRYPYEEVCQTIGGSYLT